MACVGRTKECTIVPSNHYGPIPGVPVGSQWKFRVQVSHADVIKKIKTNKHVTLFLAIGSFKKIAKNKTFVVLKVSESGVHRPHVAGIHGRSNDGSYSLVLAGGYEDDVVGVVPNPSPWKSVIFPSSDIYTNCVSRMMVMNSLTLVRGAEICPATKEQPSSRVIKRLLTWIGMVSRSFEWSETLPPLRVTFTNV